MMADKPTREEMIAWLREKLRITEGLATGGYAQSYEHELAAMTAILAQLEASRWRPIPTTLTLDDLLVLLIEECAEVIQAATKCQRFGFASNHIAEYGRNDVKLSSEIGDLAGVFAALHSYLDAAVVAGSKNSKIARAEAAKRDYGYPPATTSEDK